MKKFFYAVLGLLVIGGLMNCNSDDDSSSSPTATTMTTNQSEQTISTREQPSEPEEPSKAEMLAQLGGDYSTDAVKRLEYVLPRFAQSCKDNSNADHAAEMLFAAHQQLEETGLARQEPLLQFIENMFRLRLRVQTALSGPFQCAELYAMYVVVRGGGQTQTEAADGIASLYEVFAE